MREQIKLTAALAVLVMACTASDHGKQESDNTLVVSCEVPESGDPESGDDGDGSGSGSATPVCEDCECEDCDGEDEYEDAMCAVFPEDCPEEPPIDEPETGEGDGSGSGSGSAMGFAPTGNSNLTGDVPQDIIDKCSRVGEMTWTNTFNCRDFTTWFLRCLNDKGHTGTGLSMSCKGCDSDDANNTGHRISIVQIDGKMCPIEPQREGDAVADGCCKSISGEGSRANAKSEAEKCAHEQYCSGTWPDRTTPRPDKAGCEPDKRTPRTCNYCLNETCTEEEKRQVCKLIDHPDPVDTCGDKATNSECTQCCINEFPDRGADFNNCISSQGAGCANKPNN